jgi:hypothetical protein
MDFAAQAAIDACGTCGQTERSHQFPEPGDALSEASMVLFALAGGQAAIAAGEAVTCTHYVISEAALRYQAHLNIANGRAGRRQGPRCARCCLRGHVKENCPL